MPQNDDAPRLERSLGTWDVFSLAAGAMISSGLFVLPGLLYAHAGPSLLLAYPVAAVLILPALLAQIELATAMPRAGGNYFSVERSLGAYAGTLAGLVQWFSIALKAAFALVGLGTVALWLAPGGGGWIVKAAAVGACTLFAVLNVVSVRGAGHLQRWLVTGLVAVLVAFVLGGVPAVRPERFTPFFAGDWRAFFSVTAMVFVSYGGMNTVVDSAEEVRAPRTTLPRAMLLAYGAVNLLYLAAVFVTLGLLEPGALSGSLTPLADAARSAPWLGVAGAGMVTAAAFLAYATTGNAGILSASRGPLAMSRDGLLPAALAKTDPRRGTPVAAIVATALFMIGSILFLSLEELVKTASTMLLLSFVLANVSVLVMRRSGIQGYRPSLRVPGGPALPLAASAIYMALILDMGWGPLVTTGLFLAGASLWYLTYVHWRIDRESAVVLLVKRILSRHMGRTGLEDELRQIALERDGIETDRFDELVQNALVIDLEERMEARAFFRLLAERLAERVHLPPEELERRLLEREAESSTVIQPGLAIPHVVLPGEGRFEAALVRAREGVVFSELNPPVETAFVLLGTADERNFHLKALVAIAHIVQEPDFPRRWKEARNAEQLRDIVILSRRARHAGRGVTRPGEPHAPAAPTPVSSETAPSAPPVEEASAPAPGARGAENTEEGDQTREGGEEERPGG